MSNSLQPRGLQPTRFLRPWDSPGKNTGVGCHFLLQGNLPDPGIEPRFPALQVDALPSESYQISKTSMKVYFTLVFSAPTEQSGISTGKEVLNLLLAMGSVYQILYRTWKHMWQQFILLVEKTDRCSKMESWRLQPRQQHLVFRGKVSRLLIWLQHILAMWPLENLLILCRLRFFQSI